MYYPPLPPITMAIKRLPRMKERQLSEAQKLIHNCCCNYDQGNCLLLDGWESQKCVQCQTYSLCCTWFRDAVLPNDPYLRAEILRIHTDKSCTLCGKPIFSKSNRAKYCPVCARKERRRKEAERLHKHYLKSRI